ncbi:hypothetical protein CEXT_615901 [Caerostris extrusa]|uniref:Secreted protein n=1 Tax=Caerostris extrusa TaxID=172846 RepID=A0AAV4SJ29_CAEEX|nr:hypothetical protein CEXT_615901 [Caerostris extrusa]
MLSMKAIGGAVTGTCSPAMMMMVLTAPASTNLGRMGDPRANHIVPPDFGTKPSTPTEISRCMVFTMEECSAE